MEIQCRTCLTTTSGKMLQIFSDEALVQKIYDCTGLKLENITGMPSNICECCSSILILSHHFKMNCLEADIKLKNRYYGYTPLLENHTDEVIILNPTVDNQENTSKENSEMFMIVEMKDLDSVNVLEKNPGAIDGNSAMKTRSKPAKDAESDHKTSKKIISKEPLKQLKSIRVVEGSKVKYKTECPICGVMQQNLKQHTLVHTLEKKFACHFCEKKFSQRGNYNNHLNIHTGHHPYSCKIQSCLKSFADPNSLKSHMISHTHERKYHCDVCFKSFGYSHTLAVHKLSHTQVRNHECHCGSKFMTKYSLTKHSRIHTGEKKFKCKVCSKAFSSSGNLSTHHKVHSKVKPFKCAICNLCFAYKCVLRNHMNIHQREFSAKTCPDQNHP